MHRNFRLIILLYGLCIGTGCSERQYSLSPLAPDATIVAFGDSLTQGTGASASTSYPSILGKLAGRPIINAGIAGELSAAGLQRLPTVLAKYRPRLVLLCHGGNDLLRRRDVATLSANLRKMVDLIKSSGAEVVIIGVPQPALLLGPAPVYSDLVKSNGLVANLTVLSEVLSKSDLKSDPVHPNERGYQKIAQGIHNTLSVAGAY